MPIAKKGSHLGCSWVYAQSCLRLKRFVDGVGVLEDCKGLWKQTSSMGKHSASLRSPLPDAPAVLCLQGKLYLGYGDTKAATECFEEALRANPLMWDAFTALCDMGVNVNIANSYKYSDTVAQIFDQGAMLVSKDSVDNLVQNKLETPSRKALTPGPINGNEALSHFQAARASGISTQNGRPPPRTPETRLLSNLVTSVSGSRKRERGGLTLPRVEVVGQATRLPHAENPQTPGERSRVHTLGRPPVEIVSPLAARSEARRIFRMRRAQHGEGLSSEPRGGVESFQTSAAERKRTLSAIIAQSNPLLRGEPSTPQGGQGIERPTNMGVSLVSETDRILPGPNPINMREAKRAGRPSSRTLGVPDDEFNIPRSGRRSVSGEGRSQPISGSLGPSLGNDGSTLGTGRLTVAPPKHGDSRGAFKTNIPLKSTMNLLETMATGYYLLSKFDCEGALKSFERLPRAHRETPWVLAQMGRSHLERAAYAEAERVYRKLRVVAGTRHQDMDLYSTVLWHLNREIELSGLARDLIELSRYSPQAWCAIGNAWSRSREHEQALRCFKRATQLDPNMAYAYTLQGHEYVASEDYDKALQVYRRALSVDKRHYNAHYGIGRVYERLGNLERACTQYHIAASINPTNAVLACCIGSVLEKQNHAARSLLYYNKAIELSPKSVQPRFKKARVLVDRGDCVPAKEELLILRDLAPDEAMVHFLLGTLYKLTNENKLALRHFTFALGLDPKASLQIKEAIEGLEEREDPVTEIYIN